MTKTAVKTIQTMRTNKIASSANAVLDAKSYVNS